MRKMNFSGPFREMVPAWGPVRWTVVVLAVLILGYTGVSLFHVPEHELMYSVSRLVLPGSASNGTLVSYFVEIGNTGQAAHESVRLKLSKKAMEKSALPVSVKNYGVTDRPFTQTVEEDAAIIQIDGLEPAKRVKVSFLFRYAQGDAPETWEQVFCGMEIPRGSVKYGDPAMTMVGRAWFSFADLLPF
jgi:hypothetical protein